MLFEASQNIFLVNLQIADIPRKSNGTYLIFIWFDNPQGMISKKNNSGNPGLPNRSRPKCVQTRIQVQAYLAYAPPPP